MLSAYSPFSGTLRTVAQFDEYTTFLVTADLIFRVAFHRYHIPKAAPPIPSVSLQISKTARRTRCNMS